MFSSGDAAGKMESIEQCVARTGKGLGFMSLENRWKEVGKFVLKKN